MYIDVTHLLDKVNLGLICGTHTGAISEANHIVSHSLGVPVYSVEEQETDGVVVESRV